ncbi:MAG TPA: Hsp20/alpha crystallin family protein [Chthoniobacterales bacterium]|jgi:HSP20 family protein
MEPIRKIRLRWVHGALSDVSYQLTRFQFSRHAPHAWQPAINAYRCERCILICVELAGVTRADIDLRIEPRRVWLRGERSNPEPPNEAGQVQQMIAMEIDYGPFVRAVDLPAEVEVESATATQENGFLWISLPLKEES